MPFKTLILQRTGASSCPSEQGGRADSGCWVTDRLVMCPDVRVGPALPLHQDPGLSVAHACGGQVWLWVVPGTVGCLASPVSTH